MLTHTKDKVYMRPWANQLYWFYNNNEESVLRRCAAAQLEPFFRFQNKWSILLKVKKSMWTNYFKETEEIDNPRSVIL